MSNSCSTHLTIICLKTRRRSLKLVLASAFRFSALDGDKGAGMIASPFASAFDLRKESIKYPKTPELTWGIVDVGTVIVDLYPQGVIEELVRRRGLEQLRKRGSYSLPARGAQFLDVVLQQLLQARSADPREGIIFCNESFSKIQVVSQQ